jgi:hypothetical protein
VLSRYLVTTSVAPPNFFHLGLWRLFFPFAGSGSLRYKEALVGAASLLRV